MYRKVSKCQLEVLDTLVDFKIVLRLITTWGAYRYWSDLWSLHSGTVQEWMSYRAQAHSKSVSSCSVVAMGLWCHTSQQALLESCTIKPPNMLKIFSNLNVNWWVCSIATLAQIFGRCPSRGSASFFSSPIYSFSTPVVAGSKFHNDSLLSCMRTIDLWLMTYDMWTWFEQLLTDFSISPSQFICITFKTLMTSIQFM